MAAGESHVRFTPESRHVRCNSGCPLWANSGHLRRKKQCLLYLSKAHSAVQRLSVFFDILHPYLTNNDQISGDRNGKTGSFSKAAHK